MALSSWPRRCTSPLHSTSPPMLMTLYGSSARPGRPPGDAGHPAEKRSDGQQFAHSVPHLNHSGRKREAFMSHQRTMWKLSAAAVSALFLTLFPSLSLLHGAEFIRGDANGDGVVSLADAVLLRDSLFISGTPLPCPDAGDANDNEDLDIVDLVAIYALMVDGTPLP